MAFFYFDDDPMAVFLVETQLYKVHRYYFIQGSEFFRNLFAQAGGREDASTTEGKSDEQPIPLPEVTVKEFQTLLRFFYAMTQNITTTVTGADLLNLNFDEKLALLSISHRYMFDNIFKYMLHVICPEQINVWDRIRLGDKYDLSEWLSSAYMYLVERPSERLTGDQKECLGPVRVVQLLEAQVFMSQDRLKNMPCSRCCYSKTGRPTTPIKDIVEMFFTKPLDNLPVVGAPVLVT